MEAGSMKPGLAGMRSMSGTVLSLVLAAVVAAAPASGQATDPRQVAEANQLTLEARGVDHGGPGVSCTTDIRRDPQTYDAAGQFSDPFVVEVVQPDGSTLARTVRVQ